MIKLLHGDCLDLLDNIENNSIDLILTDPPYNISFLIYICLLILFYSAFL